MKTKALLILFLISSFALAQKGVIKIEVSNIKNSEGLIGLALYNNAQDFTKKEFKTTSVKAKKGKVIAYFKNIPAGTYAIAILHDKNKNGKMDFNMLGIPKEAYGFSNNAKGVMAPPKFKSAAFLLKENETKLVKIKL